MLQLFLTEIYSSAFAKASDNLETSPPSSFFIIFALC
ncbi:hypothetical protein [Campylobacter phage CJLB-7]|nr:hypothetical protein [Campylobacter phage CJLB-7]